jgi:hypothetical protein
MISPKSDERKKQLRLRSRYSYQFGIKIDFQKQYNFISEMGFDYYMKVIGECNFRDFIEECKGNCVDCEDDLWKTRIEEAEKWAHDLTDRSKFFNDVELELNDFKLNISYPRDEDENVFNVSDYASFIFFEILLMAIDERDPKLLDYCKVFYSAYDDDIHIHVTKKGKVKITIFYESSYKGSDKLEINFSSIQKSIKTLEEIYPSIYIYTILGQS